MVKIKFLAKIIQIKLQERFLHHCNPQCSFDCSLRHSRTVSTGTVPTVNCMYQHQPLTVPYLHVHAKFQLKIYHSSWDKKCSTHRLTQSVTKIDSCDYFAYRNIKQKRVDCLKCSTNSNIRWFCFAYELAIQNCHFFQNRKKNIKHSVHS